MIYATGDANVASAITWFGQGAVILALISFLIALFNGYIGTFVFDRDEREGMGFITWAFAVGAAVCYIADHLAVAWVR